MVKGRSAVAVRHTGDEEDAAPPGRFTGSAIGRGKRLAVAKRIERDLHLAAAQQRFRDRAFPCCS
jgi:hypothetical protein